MKDRVAKKVVTTAIPPDVLDTIKQKALADNRSVSQTLCILIEEALAARQLLSAPQTLAQANTITS